jgi:iron-sulfur cluster assembly protein
MKALLEITDEAAKAIHDIRTNKGIPEEYDLRVGIKGAGCAGVSFLLGFDKKKSSDDLMVINGINVLVDKKHAIYLAGVRVDYQNTNEATGFSFDSPDN